MKTLYAGIISLCCICNLSAQTTVPIREPDLNKPRLFEQLPQRMAFRISEVQSLFNAADGQLVDVNLADNFNFRGVVSSSAVKENGRITSVTVRSMNFNGAILSFSKVIPAEGETYFTGRIVSLQHGDGFEITRENGQYLLTKKGFYDMINE